MNKEVQKTENFHGLNLYKEIRSVLLEAKKIVRNAVNEGMLQAYWEIGRLIIEDEQGGESRAQYGKRTLEVLSKNLTDEFGKGFDIRNLRNMRAFYIA